MEISSTPQILCEFHKINSHISTFQFREALILAHNTALNIISLKLVIPIILPTELEG
jgi:hypothetical protein